MNHYSPKKFLSDAYIPMCIASIFSVFYKFPFSLASDTYVGGGWRDPAGAAHRRPHHVMPAAALPNHTPLPMTHSWGTAQTQKCECQGFSWRHVVERCVSTVDFSAIVYYRVLSCVLSWADINKKEVIEIEDMYEAGDSWLGNFLPTEGIEILNKKLTAAWKQHF